MTAEFKFKVVALGAENSGKSNFLKKFADFYDKPKYNLFLNIGVKAVKSDDRLFGLSIWDFKSSREYLHLFNTFCRGTKSFLLFFDSSDVNSFERLHFWLDLIDKYDSEIPRFLINTCNVSFNNENNTLGGKSREILVSDDNIREFGEEANITSYFHLHSNFEQSSIQNLFETICLEIAGVSLNSLNFEERKSLRRLIDRFSICPLCNSANHEEYLVSFFLSNTPEKIKVRESLLEYISNEKNQCVHDADKIMVGIPCCKCFREIFKNKKN